MNICGIIQKFCAKREKIKIEKSIVSSGLALCETNISEYSESFKIAINEIGIKEHPGENHNPRIVEYHKACELKAKSDEISWCSAFMNWCHMKSGNENRSHSATAISWAKVGSKVDEPKVGDIAIFRRVGSSWRGHVGFYVAQDEKRVLVLGGNQNNEVCFQWYPKQGKSIYLFQFRRA